MSGSGQGRGAPEAVADQDPRRMAFLFHRTCRGDQVGDVPAERGIGKVAGALSETGEVEPQNADPAGGERPGDPHGSHRGLAAREAVGEDRKGMRRSVRQVEPARQALPMRAWEAEDLRPPGHRYG